MPTNPPIPFRLVKRRLRSACRKLIREDAKLFDFDVNERTLTQRLSLYLQPKFREYAVDCEYNRDIDGLKTLPIPARRVRSDDTRAVTVFPDIVVHIRGTHENNLLVVEGKKDAPIDRVPTHDANKLKALTSQNGRFKYTWGAFLNFFRRAGGVGFELRWFGNGRELLSTEVAQASKAKGGGLDDGG